MVALAIIAVVIGQVTMLYLVTEETKGRSIRYDCSIAEISPDFPPQVKEQCRAMRAQSRL